MSGYCWLDTPKESITLVIPNNKSSSNQRVIEKTFMIGIVPTSCTISSSGTSGREVLLLEKCYC